jgi:hypothetical protein
VTHIGHNLDDGEHPLDRMKTKVYL